VVLQPRFEVLRVLRSIREQKITLLSVVPTMLKALVEADVTNQLSRLRAVLIGGAAAPESLLRICAERKIQALATYGLTEACSQVTTQRLKEVPSFEPGCGAPLSGVEIEILGADDQQLPPGEIGQIKVMGSTLMRGYLHQPPLSDAGFNTGDLGFLDREGCLHIVSRRTDLIVTGGENVYPLEVERALEACVGVEKALVFGVIDETWGQLVAVVLEVGDAFNEESFVDEMNKQLALASGKPDRAGAPSLLHGLLLPLRARQ
jgi:o-succinylbenzoate---CoA ligase